MYAFTSAEAVQPVGLGVPYAKNPRNRFLSLPLRNRFQGVKIHENGDFTAFLRPESDRTSDSE
jgi:hypothetical protein